MSSARGLIVMLGWRARLNGGHRGLSDKESFEERCVESEGESSAGIHGWANQGEGMLSRRS